VRDGRRLRRTIVPLAEADKAVAVAGLPPAQLADTRTLRLAILAHLAVDESRASLAPTPARRHRLA
jgi:hypothetical protein